MNSRLVRVALAVSSILIASIVVGGMMVLVGDLLYLWLSEIASPAIALCVLIASALTLSVLFILLGQMALQRAIVPSLKASAAARSPDQLIAGELVRLANGNPTKLLFASLGVGFALGLSPRLRRVVYQTLVD
ncbi:MAG: hypothetical protein AB7E79_07680 [Rhodospirillaceae bacterium]